MSERKRTLGNGIVLGQTASRPIARLPRFLSEVSVLVALLGLGQSTAIGSSVDLILGPGGAATLFNSSSSSVILEGYSISGSNLSPEGWVSLQSQGFTVVESSATSSQLSETTLAAGLAFGPGESRSIGHPFVLDLAADTEGDGDVDGLDLLFMQTHWGSTGPGGASIGDFNGDQVVDTADQDIWLDMYGTEASYTFAATVVPEPSSMALMGTSLALLVVRRRK